MAPSVNLSDEIALCSAATAGMFRLLVVKGLLKSSDITPSAAAAGLSEAQAAAFGRGESTLPPHQSLVLMTAVFERQRAMQVSAAENRASGAAAPVPSEITAEGAQEAVDQLARDFPSWRFPLPDGVETLGGEKPRLVWRARHTGDWADVSGVTAGELRGKIGQIEAHLKAQQEQAARYADGRGITRR